MIRNYKSCDTKYTLLQDTALQACVCTQLSNFGTREVGRKSLNLPIRHKSLGRQKYKILRVHFFRDSGKFHERKFLSLLLNTSHMKGVQTVLTYSLKSKVCLVLRYGFAISLLHLPITKHTLYPNPNLHDEDQNPLHFSCLPHESFIHSSILSFTFRTEDFVM